MPAEAAESQRLVMVSSGAGINCRTFVFKNEGRVSFQGVESLWGDSRFIPADSGS